MLVDIAISGIPPSTPCLLSALMFRQTVSLRSYEDCLIYEDCHFISRYKAPPSPHHSFPES